MKNNFNIEVNFNTSPKMPYEWDKSTTIVNIRVERISTKLLKDIMTYEGVILGRSGAILVSDAKNAVALKLGEDGTILKRSFLTFDKCDMQIEWRCRNIKNLNIKQVWMISFKDYLLQNFT